MFRTLPLGGDGVGGINGRALTGLVGPLAAPAQL
jgi:hypothetical protein